MIIAAFIASTSSSDAMLITCDASLIFVLNSLVNAVVVSKAQSILNSFGHSFLNQFSDAVC